MLRFNKSYVRKDEKWFLLNILAETLPSLEQEYNEVILILLDDLNQIVFWNPSLDHRAGDIRKSGWELREYISWAGINNQTLTPLESFVEPPFRKGVRGEDLLRLGFRMERANRYLAPDSDGNKFGDDIRLFRENTDYSLFVNQVLFSFGGLIHPVSITEHGVFLTNGFLTMQEYGIKDMVGINFEDIGGFTIKNIAEGMLYVPNKRGTGLYDHSYINVQEDISEKSIGIVLDGYLHLLDGVVSVVGPSSIKIDWRKVPLVKRALKVNKHNPAASTDRDYGDLRAGMVYSDVWIADILNSRFTYLVLLDQRNVETYQEEMISQRLPGEYWVAVNQQGLLLDELGSPIEYLRTTGDGSYTETKMERLVTSLTAKRPLLIDTAPKEEAATVTDAEARNASYYPSPILLNYFV